MTHVYIGNDKYRTWRKIRATFLLLSEEKKSDVGWSKAITSLTLPSSVFPAGSRAVNVNLVTA